MSTTAYHTNSPVSSYKRNNRLVTEGYDAYTCKYWVRFDFGQVHEFNSRDERDSFISRELPQDNGSCVIRNGKRYNEVERFFTAKEAREYIAKARKNGADVLSWKLKDHAWTPYTAKLYAVYEHVVKADLSLPQLPATTTPHIEHRNSRRGYIHLLAARGHSIPSRGVIALPASTTPKTGFDFNEFTDNQQQAIKDLLTAASDYFTQYSQLVNSTVSNYSLNGMQWKLSNHEFAAGNAAFRFAQFVSQGI